MCGPVAGLSRILARLNCASPGSMKLYSSRRKISRPVETHFIVAWPGGDVELSLSEGFRSQRLAVCQNGECVLGCLTYQDKKTSKCQV